MTMHSAQMKQKVSIALIRKFGNKREQKAVRI